MEHLCFWSGGTLPWALQCVNVFEVYYMYTYNAHNEYITWVSPRCTKSGFRNKVAGQIPKINQSIWTASGAGIHLRVFTYLRLEYPVLCPPTIEGICGPHPANCWLFFPFRHPQQTAKKITKKHQNASFSRSSRTLFIPGPIEGFNPYIHLFR